MFLEKEKPARVNERVFRSIRRAVLDYASHVPVAQ